MLTKIHNCKIVKFLNRERINACSEINRWKNPVTEMTKDNFCDSNVGANDEWVTEWLSDWMNEWMSEGMSDKFSWKSEWRDEEMKKWKNEKINDKFHSSILFTKFFVFTYFHSFHTLILIISIFFCSSSSSSLSSFIISFINFSFFYLFFYFFFTFYHVFFSIFFRVFRDVFDVFVNFTNFFSVSFSFTFDGDMARNENDVFESDENSSSNQFFSIFAQLFLTQIRKRNRKQFSSDKRFRIKKAKSTDVVFFFVDAVVFVDFAFVSVDENELNISKTTDSNAKKKFRRFDVFIKWKVFLFAFNKNHDVIIREVFEQFIKLHFNRYDQTKIKMQNNVKIYKNQVLKHAEKHLQRCFELNSLLVDNVNDDNFQQFFSKNFFSNNFLFIFRYMKDLLDVDASLELSKYYCQN